VPPRFSGKAWQIASPNEKAGGNARFPSILRHVNRRYIRGRRTINQGKCDCLRGSPQRISKSVPGRSAADGPEMEGRGIASEFGPWAKQGEKSPSGKRRTGEARMRSEDKVDVDSVRHWAHGELSASSETGDTG